RQVPARHGPPGAGLPARLGRDGRHAARARGEARHRPRWAGANRHALQRHGGGGRRPRLRSRHLPVGRDDDRRPHATEPEPGTTRQGALLRPSPPCRQRGHQRRGAAHQRRRAGDPRAWPPHRGPLRRGQQRRAARHRRRLPERPVELAWDGVWVPGGAARRAGELAGAAMDWFKKKKRWDLETDVLALGTGAAGMTAALAAHAAGASVMLLEKSRLVGGTTAVSGGVVWVPNNHHLAEVGIEDSRAEALAYVKRLTDGRTDDALVERFVDTAPAMVEWVEAQTPLRFKALARYPDYHPEFPGGKPGGRSLDPGLFDANDLGPWKKSLRRSPVFGMTAMTVAEATDWGVFSKPLKVPFKLLGERYR